MKRAPLSVCCYLVCLAFSSFGWAYQVQPGDNLWELSGIKLDDPQKWHEVWVKNPHLKGPERIFERNGKTIVLLYPGEELVGLDALSIVPVPLSLSILQPPAPPVITSHAPAPAVARESFFEMMWPWVLLAALIMTAILWFYTRRRGQNLPASQAGPAVVPGGVSHLDPPAVEGRFNQIAERYQIVVGSPDRDNYAIARPERVGEIERGFLSGCGLVEYAGGRVEERVMNRETAYRANFRMPDASVQTLHFLQECGNDVRFQGVHYTGYMFEPMSGGNRVVVPAPTSTTPTPPAEQTATTATVSSANPEPPIPAIITAPIPLRPASMVMTLEGLRITLPEGSTVETAGGEITLVLQRSGQVSIRRVAQRRERSTAQQPPAVKSVA